MSILAEHCSTKEFSLRLFGSPRLNVGGAPVRLNERALCVLAYIVVHRNDGMLRRKEAALELWPDVSECAAYAMLRRALHDLGAQVRGFDLLMGDATWFAWNTENDASVDVVQFEDLSNARMHPAAVQLYRADLLEKLDCDWVCAERDRLRDLQIVNLQRAAAACTDGGDFCEALRFVKQLLSMDPWREDVFRDVMTLSFLCGNRAGALHEYAVFESRLQQELGVGPMPETTNCRAMIARGELPADSVFGRFLNAFGTRPLLEFPQ